jgi:hypothetical protein
MQLPNNASSLTHEMVGKQAELGNFRPSGVLAYGARKEAVRLLLTPLTAFPHFAGLIG